MKIKTYDQWAPFIVLLVTGYGVLKGTLLLTGNLQAGYFFGTAAAAFAGEITRILHRIASK